MKIAKLVSHWDAALPKIPTLTPVSVEFIRSTQAQIERGRENFFATPDPLSSNVSSFATLVHSSVFWVQAVVNLNYTRMGRWLETYQTPEEILMGKYVFSGFLLVVTEMADMLRRIKTISMNVITKFKSENPDFDVDFESFVKELSTDEVVLYPPPTNFDRINMLMRLLASDKIIRNFDQRFV